MLTINNFYDLAPAYTATKVNFYLIKHQFFSDKYEGILPHENVIDVTLSLCELSSSNLLGWHIL
ncbi:MAG: hypothetical protein WBB28_26210 [Crinalium sp.]